MTADDARDVLTEKSVKFEENELQHGRRFKCGSGEVIVAYNTGTVSCQGKPTELSKAVKDWKRPAMPAAAAPTAETTPVAGPNKHVFIVYGHDTNARDALELVLPRLALDPIV